MILLLIPVVLTGTYGWFFFEHELFVQNWNVGHASSSSAIMAAVVLCIWSFIGVESASVNAGLVENPRRNIPLATMIGTCVAGLVYFASSTAISGMFPAKEVAASGAPFALAAGHMFGKWSMPVVSAVTAFACLASLGSWIMMIAQAAARSARDGALPAAFGEKNKKGIPAKGIVITSIFLTVLMLTLMIVSKGGNTQDIFGEIVSITVLFTVIPYFYSALQLLKLGCTGRKKAIFVMIVSVIACVFCFTALAGAEHAELIWALAVIFGILMFYTTKDRAAFVKNQQALVHEHESDAPEN
ncbi:MAG: amino acid permease [Spartobacteria bacterium]|nr:amino acid permease [Spartobacteria bacterium]